MSKRTKRRIIDGIIGFTVFATVGTISGNNWLILPVALYGIWCYYDGMTRMELPR